MIHRNLGPLFDQPAPKVSVLALRNARQASAEAAEKIAPRVGLLHRQILRCLLGGAMTDEAMQAALNMNPSTQRPRRGELVDAGLVEDSGWFGRTASGAKAVKWRLTTQGEQEART